MGYQGERLTKYLAGLGLELSIVKRPRKWFWVKEGQEIPVVPKLTLFQKDGLLSAPSLGLVSSEG
jgi:hypothetical protein